MAALAVLVVGLGWSMTIGTATIGLGAVLAAVTGGATTPGELIARTIRLPRALLAGVVGSSMAVSGAVMQGITANPLAAPEIMGVSAGAAVVVVACLTLFTSVTGQVLVAAAFAGGALAGVVVGLIAPHIARRLVGGRHLALLPTSAAVGVVLMLAADALGRGVNPPLEVPVGLVTALIGGPYFLYLLAKTARATRSGR